MTTYVVGIDCATEPQKVGLCLAAIEEGRCKILKACTGDRNNFPTHIADKVAQWHKETPLSLLALDAPLGWPDDLAKSLLNHRAGDYIGTSTNKLFLRTTDRHVKRTLGQTPLKMGAYRISLTAIAALDILRDLRAKLSKTIPLCWEMGIAPELSAIEVFPAATCRSLGLPPKINRKTGESQDDFRKRLKQQVDLLLESLPNSIELEPLVIQNASTSPDVYDAVLCAVAAHEFIAKRCVAPPPDLPHTEGWIWVGGLQTQT